MTKQTQTLGVLGSVRAIEDAVGGEQVRSRCPSHGSVRR